MDDLVEFLRAQLDKDEASARDTLENEVIPYDRAIQRLYQGGWRSERASDHIARWHPQRVLREVEAKRILLDEYERLVDARRQHEQAAAQLDADIETENRTGEWPGPGYPDVRQRAIRREADYLNAMQPVLERLIQAEAAVYADYREKWRP